MKCFKVSVIVSTLVVLSLGSSSAEEVKCKIPVHYKELGCTPVLKEGEKCASSYNCDHWQKLDSNKCHFRGATFGDNHGPERPELPPCVPYANCFQGYFMAGHIDCGHSRFHTPEEKCVDIKDGCCPRTVCGEEAEKLSVCHMDGQTFRSGEKWQPKEDPCIQCTCDEHFENSTSIYENKNCKNYDCFTDFWHLHEFRKDCAPRYYGKDRCCPSTAKCPSADDKLIKATEPSTSDLKCKFGDLELHIGDKVNDSNNCMDCTCLTPPLVECHLRENCEQIY